MKAFSEDLMKQHDCRTAQTQKLSTRLERSWTPIWSSETKIEKDAEQGRSRAATLAIDTRIKGDRKLLHAHVTVNSELSKVACQCRLRGTRTCTLSCLCQSKWKSCGIECECHGFCCNSFFHTPRLSIRNGALGEELYTKSYLPQYKVAFVVCGRVMTILEYWRYHEKLFHKTVRHYGFMVSWPGSIKGLPGNSEIEKYAIDPFEDMTGAMNHSCEPNIALEPCWANGKVYLIGRTKRNIMVKEALTTDYKWKGTTSFHEFAEICLCREGLCRGLVAEKQSKLMVSSLQHYEEEIIHSQEKHTIAEKALQQRYEDLALATQIGTNTVELEMEIIRKENENGKLKANVELMIAAVARARASLSDFPRDSSDIKEINEVKKNLSSLLKKFIQKLRVIFLDLPKRRKNSDLVPCEGSVIQSLTQRIVPMHSARSQLTINRSSNRVSISTRQSGFHALTASSINPTSFTDRPRYLTAP